MISANAAVWGYDTHLFCSLRRRNLSSGVGPDFPARAPALSATRGTEVPLALAAEGTGLPRLLGSSYGGPAIRIPGWSGAPPAAATAAASYGDGWYIPGMWAAPAPSASAKPCASSGPGQKTCEPMTTNFRGPREWISARENKS